MWWNKKRLSMEKNRIEEAILKFRSGSNCAQAVLSTYLPELGIPEPVAHRMGTGLGAGIGRKQYTCGALNAGAIVLSAHLGNEKGDDVARKEMTLDRVRQLVDGFEEKFTSSQCIEIIGIDTSTAEGRKRASEAGVFRRICDFCVEEVCRRLEEELVAPACGHSEVPDDGPESGLLSHDSQPGFAVRETPGKTA
jgi:C_GCAxxG_C_C family probable redox protein